LARFFDKGTKITGNLRHEHQDVLLKVEVFLPVNVGQKGHNCVFDGLDHDGNELGILPDFPDNIPQLVNDDLLSAR
jgi:hypothetical protein